MNRLIASLPADARELLEKDMHVVELQKGQVLYRIDEPVTHVFFPHGGLVSLVVLMESGETAEVSLIGREGLAALALFWVSRTPSIRQRLRLAARRPASVRHHSSTHIIPTIHSAPS